MARICVKRHCFTVCRDKKGRFKKCKTGKRKKRQSRKSSKRKYKKHGQKYL